MNSGNMKQGTRAKQEQANSRYERGAQAPSREAQEIERIQHLPALGDLRASKACLVDVSKKVCRGDEWCFVAMDVAKPLDIQSLASKLSFSLRQA